MIVTPLGKCRQHGAHVKHTLVGSISNCCSGNKPALRTTLNSPTHSTSRGGTKTGHKRAVEIEPNVSVLIVVKRQQVYRNLRAISILWTITTLQRVVLLIRNPMFVRDFHSNKRRSPSLVDMKERAFMYGKALELIFSFFADFCPLLITIEENQTIVAKFSFEL